MCFFLSQINDWIYWHCLERYCFISQVEYNCKTLKMVDTSFKLTQKTHYEKWRILNKKLRVWLYCTLKWSECVQIQNYLVVANKSSSLFFKPIAVNVLEASSKSMTYLRKAGCCAGWRLVNFFSFLLMRRGTRYAGKTTSGYSSPNHSATWKKNTRKVNNLFALTFTLFFAKYSHTYFIGVKLTQTENHTQKH